jgi:hypothetical protein
VQKAKPEKQEASSLGPASYGLAVSSIGCRRGEGDKREFWIEPLVWTEELCGDEIDPQDAARTLKELGLLRTQDDNSFQIVAKVRQHGEVL